MIWITGFLLVFGVGMPLNITAQSLAAASLLAPFGSFSIIASALIARYLFREPLYGLYYVCGAAIMVGCSITGISGVHVNEPMDSKRIIQLLRSRRMRIYTTIALVSIVPLGVFAYCYDRANYRRRRDRPALEAQNWETDSEGNGIGLALLPKPTGTRCQRMMTPIAFGMLNGCLEACVNVGFKIVGKLVASKDSGSDLFWVTIPIILTFGVFNIYFQNLALRNFKNTLFGPLYRVFMILYGVLSGWLVFNELQYASGTIPLFVFGVCLVMCGVLALVTRESVDDRDSIQRIVVE